jgi:hypothetical protein
LANIHGWISQSANNLLQLQFLPTSQKRLPIHLQNRGSFLQHLFARQDFAHMFRLNFLNGKIASQVRLLGGTLRERAGQLFRGE